MGGVMFKYIPSIVLALGLCSSAALADSQQVFKSGNWLGERSFDAQGFNHCRITTSYVNGITLTFSLGANYNFGMFFYNSAWSLTKGDKIPLQFWVDRYPARNGTAIAGLPTMVYLDIEDTESLFREMRKGYLLNILAAGKSFKFSLDGTFVALKKMRECVNVTLAASNPGGARPQPRRSDLTDAQAISLAANLLSQAGLSGYRILDRSEFETTTLKNYDVVWMSDRTFGALQVFAPGHASSAQMLSDAVTYNESQLCKDGFFSGRRTTPDETLKGAVRLYIGCAATGDIRVYHTIVPRNNGGYFLFSHAALPPKVENSNVAKEEGLKRQAKAEFDEGEIMKALPASLNR